MKPPICKTEPTLQLSFSSQHQISHVTSDPAPSLQIGLQVLSHRRCGTQLLRNTSPMRALKWILMHWSPCGGHSELVSLQSFHDLTLEHEWHSKLDAANEYIGVTYQARESYWRHIGWFYWFSNDICKIEREQYSTECNSICNYNGSFKPVLKINV